MRACCRRFRWAVMLVGVCCLNACGGGIDHAVADALAQGIVPALDTLGSYANSLATTRYACTTDGAAALLLGLPAETTVEYEVSNAGHGGFNVTYATGKSFHGLASGGYRPSDESAGEATFTVLSPQFTVNPDDGSVIYPADQTARSLTVQTAVADGEWVWSWPNASPAFAGPGTIPAGTTVSWRKVVTARAAP